MKSFAVLLALLALSEAFVVRPTLAARRAAVLATPAEVAMLDRVRQRVTNSLRINTCTLTTTS
jgi:hypothetical protein